MDRLNPSVAQRAADVSGALTPRTAELATEIYDLIMREIPLLRGDKQVLTLLEASVGENVATLLHVLEHGIDLENVHLPVAAAEYARRSRSAAYPSLPCCGPTGSAQPGSRTGAWRNSGGARMTPRS